MVIPLTNMSVPEYIEQLRRMRQKALTWAATAEAEGMPLEAQRFLDLAERYEARLRFAEAHQRIPALGEVTL